MFFSLKHSIFAVGKVCQVVFVPEFPLRISKTDEYLVEIIPFSGLKQYGAYRKGMRISNEVVQFYSEKHKLIIKESDLGIQVTFPQEDAFLFLIFLGDQKIETHEVYALEEDLFGLLPLKGDNHLHSCHSDGMASAEYMAAAMCMQGCDYCVITDHSKYEPSQQAQKFFEGTGADFLILSGEEIHSPDNHVHIINVGGTESVNSWYQEHEDEYRSAVEKELIGMNEPMSSKDRYAAAASQVVFEKINEIGGVSIFCHPNWIVKNGFQESEDITDYLFDHKRFDVLELIAGGAYEVGTQLQLAYYLDRPNMSIVGNSDAHQLFGGRLEPGNYTIVFVKEKSREAIKAALKSGKCIGGNENKLYGNYRLVKYGYFLRKNLVQKHDAASTALGKAMLRYAAGYKDTDSMHSKEIADAPHPTEIYEKAMN